MVEVNMYGRGRGLQLAILITCQIAFVLFGYNQGVFSGIIKNEDFLNIVNHPQAGMLGFLVSIYNLGCFFGTFIAFVTTDRLGFQKSMWFSMSWIVIGGTIQACSYSLTQLLISRFVNGIGTGIMSTVVPVYQSELCEARKRGKYVCTQPLAVGFGIVIAYWFDYGMTFVTGSISWRLPIACQEVFAICVVIMVAGLPESPRWLYRKHRGSEALKVLCKVYGREADDPKVIAESEGILRALDMEAARGEYRWSQILKRDELQTGPRVLMAYGLQFMNQMGGTNIIVVSYDSVLEDNVGLTPKMSSLLGGVIQIMFVIGSFYPTLYSDKLGRRKPMMWGSFGLGVCMLMLGILFSFEGTPQEQSTATAAVAFFFLFMLIFGASTNCIPWPYGPELLPLHARTKGQSIGVSANWLWNFFVAMITPLLLQKLHWKTYLIFMCLNFSFIPLIYFFYPETANLTLEDIDTLFLEKSLKSRRLDEERNQKECEVSIEKIG
ncbi:sugar transporter-like protein [Aspergillus clavatus NRRL 1]|uniref:Hexose carrier protein n=1 Tax=Aspergillus clavatus (strain ATCC 1007 / CBS 513.65 / DSM 816 / NCTC 3887 / NRRL 1 / QM 1276 / 107) TaxID=344612 RepID=A1CL17_ASPCL|nr:hexose carrier protein [Aspergillus clavatus NRRL 1]EAW09841.1 hexose carrier protein [Aspergillus clavatus NRRL 1]